ncbi:metallophosphoesterase [Lysinibacillus macroides]|uniref:Phosphoesterase n=1 Tax=Lysinibacillus macroides TaxID=33935 RepID=A0A0M9DIN1_9BACI|nr:metallophosphoesterase [Lysinibacillus macroides]KOY81140.1 metallophosphatase [Lysinibacillus macroides]QPR68708.1 metallophosphoesterase [Lysinibacillus macroides]
MKILVMSDTHGDSHVIDKVRSFYPEIDMLIHCGDSELPFSHLALAGMKKVRGNCDHDQAFPEEEIFTVDNVTIFAAHGHLLNVKSSMLSLSYRAKEVGAQLVCYGHSHILDAEVIDNILFLNPGSLLKPRGRKEKSFAVVEIDDTSFKIDFWTDQHECIGTQTFPRYQ